MAKELGRQINITEVTSTVEKRVLEALGRVI
jgi:hypothetical protein